MSKLSYHCSCSGDTQCSLLAIAVSVVIGIITTLLTITAVISVTPVFLWVVFGIAIVYLAVTLLVSASLRCLNECRCIDTPLSLVLVGILTTILTATILLAIEFAATSVLGAIITGVLLLFFSLFITSTACLIRCLASMENYNDSMYD